MHSIALSLKSGKRPNPVGAPIVGALSRVGAQHRIDTAERAGTRPALTGPDIAKTCHDITILFRQIETTDRQIDRLVYELYDLTDAEIKIVES